MTHPSPEPGRPTVTAEAHARHDASLIAEYVGRDVDDRTRVAALGRIAGCADCAALADDLRSIATATRGLPARRPPPGRSFTLDPAQAARLGRGRRLLAFLRPFGRAGFAPAQPIGVALSALGLVGILVAGGLGGFMGLQGAGAPERDGNQGMIGTPGGSYDPTTQGTGEGDATPLPPAGPGAEWNGPGGIDRSLEPTAAPDETKSRDVTTEDERDPGPILVVSGILVAVGLMLLALRRAAVRLT